MNYIRLAIIFIGSLLLAMAVHLLVYGTLFTYAKISDSLFVIGIIFLLPSFIAMTNAYKVFHGISYVFRVFISPSFRKEYPRFGDFMSERNGKIKSTIFYEMFVSSLVLVIASAILATVAMR